VGQVGNLWRVAEPAWTSVNKLNRRRLATGAQDVILPHIRN